MFSFFQKRKQRKLEARERSRIFWQKRVENKARAIAMSQEDAEKLAMAYIGNPKYFTVRRVEEEPGKVVPPNGCPLFARYLSANWYENDIVLDVDYLSMEHVDDPSFMMIGELVDAYSILVNDQGVIRAAEGDITGEDWPSIYHYIVNKIFDFEMTETL